MPHVPDIKSIDDMWQLWQGFIYNASKVLVNVLKKLS